MEQMVERWWSYVPCVHSWMVSSVIHVDDVEWIRELPCVHSWTQVSSVMHADDVEKMKWIRLVELRTSCALLDASLFCYAR